VLLIKLSLSAMMAALSIVLCRLLGFSPGDSMLRIEIGFLPVALVGALFGPLWGALTYGVADLVGSLVTTGMNPLILVCKILTGLLFGFLPKRRRGAIIPTVLLMLTVGVVIDVALMSGVFVLYGYAPTYFSAMLTRLLNAGVNLPIRIFLYLLTLSAAEPAIKRLERSLSMKTGFQAYANSFQAVSRLGLERISELLAELGNPENELSCIHIAGTNGKGSVAAYLSAILTEAGYRTGLYTSPNLVSVTERIQISGEKILESDLSALLNRVETACNRMQARGSETPTQFEIWTAAAFLYFAEKKVDYVVLETGLGGEFDATNVIPRNVLSILTRIDLDHTQYLGNTLAEIARTKSKIIKADSTTHTVISAPQSEEVMAVISKEAERCGCRALFVNPPAPDAFEEIFERFTYEGLPLLPSLGGTHQIENAAIAVSAARAISIDDASIIAGIASAKHPARMELLSDEPLILYDGGHNPNGLTALSASLDRYYPGTRFTVIFAAMKDKEIAPSLKLLSEKAETFLFTTVRNNPRAMTAEELSAAAAALGVAGKPLATLADAISEATSHRSPILICGSLYLYADLPEELRSI
jgi:dihydrofolate synthase/folylpolyglutamate synthase